jgi:hypothetical protein
MSATYPGGCGVAAMRSVGDATALRATDWLCLGAAPTFAIMALLTCVFGGQTDILCSAAAPTSPLTGMIPMYLLMSAFHSSPWLKLMSSRRNFTDRIEPPHSNRRSHQCSQDAGSAGLHPSGRCCPALFGSSDLRVRRLVRFSGGKPRNFVPSATENATTLLASVPRLFGSASASCIAKSRRATSGFFSSMQVSADATVSATPTTITRLTVPS